MAFVRVEIGNADEQLKKFAELEEHLQKAKSLIYDLWAGNNLKMTAVSDADTPDTAAEENGAEFTADQDIQ